MLKKENNFPIFSILSPPLNKGIFLLETSGRNYLNPKELCALESAAKNNPNRQIYYLLTNIELKVYPALNSLLDTYFNINVVGIELSSFFLRTPMEYLWFHNKIQNSKHKVSHLSDVLRFLIIATYGGTYLDSDIIVLKEFPTHFNFAGVEHVEKPFVVAVGIFHFSKNHTIINRCVNHMAKNFNGDSWSHNGPFLMTNTVKNICNFETMEEINNSNCYEIKLLSPEECYPIYYKDWEFYFNPLKNDHVRRSLKDSYIAHLWGKFSSDVPINKNTTLFELANNNCPIVAKNYL
ncbi:lactosylceramide 4-alpha-galactosyltransferase [Lepeophtheirus salmonis]|uniref:lactosylceramide 4-alpha-galactosyltransferase n=1 Tax=Lepeophtheirus salmonis TaxID=72036 RepID=UPI001AE7440C|nr:lactosylceramide 4-alpha-galactosyltransferase-like [Lepeophtheirus salmonis]